MGDTDPWCAPPTAMNSYHCYSSSLQPGLPPVRTGWLGTESSWQELDLNELKMQRRVWQTQSHRISSCRKFPMRNVYKQLFTLSGWFLLQDSSDQLLKFSQGVISHPVNLHIFHCCIEANQPYLSENWPGNLCSWQTTVWVSSWQCIMY